MTQTAAASNLQGRGSAREAETGCVAMGTGGHEQESQSAGGEDSCSCDEEDESCSLDTGDYESSRSWSQPEGPLGSAANEWSEMAAQEFENLLRGLDSNTSRVFNLMPAAMAARNASIPHFQDAATLQNSTLSFRVLPRMGERDWAFPLGLPTALNGNLSLCNSSDDVAVSAELRNWAMQMLPAANHHDMPLPVASGAQWPDAGSSSDVLQSMREQLAAEFWREVFVNGSATAVEEARDRAMAQGEGRTTTCGKEGKIWKERGGATACVEVQGTRRERGGRRCRGTSKNQTDRDRLHMPARLENGSTRAPARKHAGAHARHTQGLTSKYWSGWSASRRRSLGAPSSWRG